MDKDLLLLLIILCIPPVSVLLFIKVIKHYRNKFFIFFIATSTIIIVDVLMILLSFLMEDKSSNLEKTVCISLICLAYMMAFLPTIQHKFNTYHVWTNEKCKVGRDFSDYVDYYKSSRKVFFVAYVFRIVLFSMYIVLFMIAVNSLFIQDRDFLIKTIIILAFFGFLFLACNAFLRLLVKCPNCGSHVFYMDKDLNAYFVVAKRVVKEKVLDCEYCYATYALDSSLNLEELRKQKKDRIKKDKEAKNDR